MHHSGGDVSDAAADVVIRSVHAVMSSNSCFVPDVSYLSTFVKKLSNPLSKSNIRLCSSAPLASQWSVEVS